MAESEYKNVWSYGPYLIARHRVAQFPPRCLVCGEGNGCKQLSCTVRKRPGFLQLLFWITGPFSASVVIRPFFCVRHHTRERRSRWIGHAMLVLAIAMLVIPFYLALNGKDASDMCIIAAVGAALAWAWVYYRIFRNRLLYAEYIKQRDAWIQGIHESVMEQVTALPCPSAD